MHTHTQSTDAITRRLPAVAIAGPGERPLEEQYPARDPEGPPDVQPDEVEFPRAAAPDIEQPGKPNSEPSPPLPGGDVPPPAPRGNPERDRRTVDGDMLG